MSSAPISLSGNSASLYAIVDSLSANYHQVSSNPASLRRNLASM